MRKIMVHGRLFDCIDKEYDANLQATLLAGLNGYPFCFWPNV